MKYEKFYNEVFRVEMQKDTGQPPMNAFQSIARDGLSPMYMSWLLFRGLVEYDKLDKRLYTYFIFKTIVGMNWMLENLPEEGYSRDTY